MTSLPMSPDRILFALKEKSEKTYGEGTFGAAGG
jgi:hypothetical protein